jgi:hypothetical protein
MSGRDEPREHRGRPDGVLSWIDNWLSMVRRTAPGPVLVRGSVFVAALLAQLVAWPGAVVLGRPVLALLVIAILPALFPRTWLVTMDILVTVIGWLVGTTSYGGPVTYWRLVLLAGLLYLVHTLAALAAVLPYDAVTSPGVLARWLRRCGAVVLLTAAVAMFTLLLPAYLPGQRFLVASLAGLALTVAIAGYLATLVRRR